MSAKLVAIMGVCAVIVVAMVVAVAVGVTRSRKGEAGGGDGGSEISASQKAVKSICEPTDHKDTCEKSLAGLNTTEPKDLIKAGFQAAVDETEKVMDKCSTIQEAAKDPMARKAVDTCKECLGYAIDDLNASMNQLGEFDVSKLNEYVENLKIWSGGAITFQETCLDGFTNVTGDTGDKMKALLAHSQELTNNGLAMVSGINKLFKELEFKGGHNRKLLDNNDHDGFPSWVSFRQRMLLQQKTGDMNPNVVVAQDGSGKYKTIKEALNEVPKKNKAPFVIHIKAGVYKEQVIVEKNMVNVVFVGDGPTKTKITGSLNFIDGTSTFKTATVAAIGPGFLAKNIGFENSAGAIKHQAVALKVQSDQSIFYNCQMDGYQDTLYAHTHRQFYRDCTVSGTIDFLFGNAAVVFQNCKLIVRKPLDKQQCMVTAQGRTDKREVTGIVLQNCAVSGDPDYLPVKDASKTHLGRPWKEFSRTIVMQCQLDDIVAPVGWMPWEGNFALDTLWYAEFNNRGPGADQRSRVQWKGIKRINDAQAKEFTAGVFLRGDEWIPNSGVPYIAGMVPNV